MRNSGAAKARHDFVGNELRAVAAGDGSRAAQPAGRLRNHPCGALHERLKNESHIRIAFALLRRELPFNEVQTLVIAAPVFTGVGALGLGAIERAAIAVRRHDLVGLEEQARVGLVKKVNVAEPDRADGVAVVGAFKGKKARTLRTASAAGESVGKFEGDFESRRTIVRKENFPCCFSGRQP